MPTKHLLSALTAVATGLISMPAVAALNHTEIVKHLHAIGVTTSLGDCSMSHGDPESLMGTYNSLDNHFCISEQATASAELLDEVVTHELTHVIQDCLGDGIASPNMGSITRYLSEGDTDHENILDQGLFSVLHAKGKMDHVREHTSHMEGGHKFIEFEAYALESSPLFVIKLLAKCQPQN
jgi:hypothetical protein